MAHTERSVGNDTYRPLFALHKHAASHFLWKWLLSTLAVRSAAINQTFYCRWIHIYQLVCAASDPNRISGFFFFFWLKETVWECQAYTDMSTWLTVQATSLLQPHVFVYCWNNSWKLILGCPFTPVFSGGYMFKLLFQSDWKKFSGRWWVETLKMSTFSHLMTEYKLHANNI